MTPEELTRMMLDMNPKENTHPSEEQQEERVDFAIKMLATRTVFHGKKEFMRKFELSWSAAEHYFRIAKHVVRSLAHRSREESIAETLNQLDEMILDPETPDKIRLVAIQTKNRMLGYNAPLTLRVAQDQPPLFDRKSESENVLAIDTGIEDREALEVPQSPPEAGAEGNRPVSGPNQAASG